MKLRSLLFSFLVLFATNCYALDQNVIVDSSEESIVQLNEELRKLKVSADANTAAIGAIDTTETTEFSAGMILLWSGAIADIPTGWVICDGNNGTPDLTDRFVIHADADSGGTRDVGDTGGAHDVTITEAQLPSHVHTINHGHTIRGKTGGSGEAVEVLDEAKSGSYSDIVEDYSGNSGSAGSGDSMPIIPKYYALAYIMKT